MNSFLQPKPRKIPSACRRMLFLALLFAMTGTAGVYAHNNTVSGIVISSSDNQPIAGAVLMVEGTQSGTITDQDGNFTLRLPAGAKTVTVSMMGFDSKQIPADQPILFRVISMVEKVQEMDDVVVVGFGVQKKESLVGAVQSVKPSSLTMSTSNLSSAFAGKVAGMVSVQSSGEPGADGADFWIRGISTFGSNKSPLIILDGVEIDNTILNSIAPETIEQFSILKDATATALYGSRGANGVMIVTTKSGRNSERMAINIRLEQGFTMPTRITDVADGVTYMENYNESRTTRGISPYYDVEKIENTRLGTDPYIYPDVNWYEQLFKSFGHNQNLNVNMRGGGKKLDYFLNLSVHNERGMLRNTGHSNYNTGDRMQKYTFQSNVSADMTKTTRVSLKMTTQLMNKNSSSAEADELFEYTMTTNPVEFAAYYPAQEGDDHVRFGSWDSWDGGAAQVNPYAVMNRGYMNQFWGNVLATLTVDQDLSFVTKGLKISALASFKNKTDTKVYNMTTPFLYKLTDSWLGADGKYEYETSPIGGNGSNYLSGTTSNSGERTLYFQGKMDYNRSFGKHDVAATAVFLMTQRNLNVPSASQFDILPYRDMGVAARLTYGYDSRYLLEANFGYNGSENFAKGYRWGFFPSVAAGWVISNEKFFAPAKSVLSLLKLRASYGLAGNDHLASRFAYVTYINMASTDNEYKAFLGKNPVAYNGVKITQWANEMATWEVGRKLNIGLELGLFNDLTLIADFFREERTGIFMRRETVPSTSGFQEATPYGNIGGVLNRGIDISLEYNKAINKDLIISAQGTFTFAHNVVTEKDDPINRPEYQKYKGKPVNAIEGLVAAGLFESDEEVAAWPSQNFGPVQAGDIRYLDLNGDNVVDGNDMVPLGYPTVPEITYGFGMSVKWKGLDASFFFQGVGRVSLMMNNHHPFVSSEYSGRNMVQWIADDHWTEENQNTSAAYPRLSATWNMNNSQKSSFWIRNGSYIRLKNVEVGYTIKSLRIYAAGTNLFTLSPFKYWDPELGGYSESSSKLKRRGNGLSYPLQRVIKLGVQYNF